jgi:hypothetical protein
LLTATVWFSARQRSGGPSEPPDTRNGRGAIGRVSAVLMLLSCLLLALCAFLALPLP